MQTWEKEELQMLPALARSAARYITPGKQINRAVSVHERAPREGGSRRYRTKCAHIAASYSGRYQQGNESFAVGNAIALAFQSASANPATWPFTRLIIRPLGPAVRYSNTASLWKKSWAVIYCPMRTSITRTVRRTITALKTLSFGCDRNLRASGPKTWSNGLGIFSLYTAACFQRASL